MDFNIEECNFKPQNILHEAWSDDGKVRTNEQMKAYAEAAGCTFEEADDRTLFIDIDSDLQYTVFVKNSQLAKKLFGPMPVKITESKSSNGHKHIRVTLPESWSLLQRLVLQACLGSDLKREMIGLKRQMAGEENVIVFFEKKEQNA